MRRIAILLSSMLVLLVFCLPVSGYAAVDPVNVSAAKVWMDIRVPGPCTAELYIQSVSTETVEVNVSSWWNYIQPEPDSRWIDPSWLSRISPESQELKPGEKMLVNIEVTVPSSAPDVKYQAWVRIAVGDWEKPITLNIRKGAAIPDYKYAISPAFKALLAYGPGAKMTVEAADLDAIVVTSQCSADTVFMVEPEAGCLPFTVSEEQVSSKDEKGNYTSAMFGGKPEWLGSKWQGLSVEEIALWFTTTATEEHPLRIGPYTTGRIGWSLTVPDKTEDGNYWFWVRLQPAEPNPAFMGTEYLIKFFVTVKRQPQEGAAVWPWIMGAIGICLGAGGIVWSASWLKAKYQTVSSQSRLQAVRRGNRLTRRNALR